MANKPRTIDLGSLVEAQALFSYTEACWRAARRRPTFETIRQLEYAWSHYEDFLSPEALQARVPNPPASPSRPAPRGQGRTYFDDQPPEQIEEP